MASQKTSKERWRLDINNTALVVIDMQRAFVDKGAPMECIGASDLVAGINRLTALCRRLGIPVIFVKANRRADLSDSGLSKDFLSSRNNELSALQGMKGNEFVVGLNVAKTDYVVPKIRYSALIPGSSHLEPLLRGLRKDRFIICGVATDVCVGATTMDAMMLGFKVFLVGDLTSTFNEERQRIALEVYDKHFAKVVTFDKVMKELSQWTRKRGG